MFGYQPTSFYPRQSQPLLQQPFQKSYGSPVRAFNPSTPGRPLSFIQPQPQWNQQPNAIRPGAVSQTPQVRPSSQVKPPSRSVLASQPQFQSHPQLQSQPLLKAAKPQTQPPSQLQSQPPQPQVQPQTVRPATTQNPASREVAPPTQFQPIQKPKSSVSEYSSKMVKLIKENQELKSQIQQLEDESQNSKANVQRLQELIEYMQNKDVNDDHGEEAEDEQ